jgi:hypothetical protein
VTRPVRPCALCGASRGRATFVHVAPRRSHLRVLLVGASLASAACYYPYAWIPFVVAGTAITTAAIISATAPPPPPQVVYAPAPKPGYAWQPGYWVREQDRWVWVEGQWVTIPPGYGWAPTQWRQRPDGRWELVQGTLVPVAP